MALPLNCHAQDVGRTLEERDIILIELTFRSAVDLQHAKGRTVPLHDNNVYRSPNPRSGRQRGRSKAFLPLQAERRAASSSSSARVAPFNARTPSSANFCCWRILNR